MWHNIEILIFSCILDFWAVSVNIDFKFLIIEDLHDYLIVSMISH